MMVGYSFGCCNKIYNIYWVMPNLWDLFNLVNNQDKDVKEGGYGRSRWKPF